MEDAEQDGRIGREVVGEPGGPEPETQRDAAHHGVGDATHRVEPLEHQRSEFGRLGRELVASVQGGGGEDPGMVRSVLGAEVDPLLAVGDTRRQFAADREPSAPGRAGVRHRDPGLHVLGAFEECAGGGLEAILERGVDAVTGDGEESDVPAGLIDRRCRSGPVGRRSIRVDQRSDVDERKVWGWAHELVTYCSATGA